MKQDLCVKHKCVWTHTYVHFGAPVELWSPQIVWTNVGQILDISFSSARSSIADLGLAFWSLLLLLATTS